MICFWEVYNNIQLKTNENIDNMKFNAIVGNPPYKISDGGGGKKIGGSSVYHHFVNSGICLRPQYVTMIIPARWYSGSNELSDFRSSMINDGHLVKIYDFPKSYDCFKNAEIAGGVCFFLWDQEYIEKCEFCSFDNGKFYCSKMDLSTNSILIRNSVGAIIIEKICVTKDKSYYSRVFSSKPFGLRTYYRGADNPFEGALTLHSSEGVSYIESNEVKKNKELIDSYKVFIGLLDPDRAGVNNSTKGRNVITKVKMIGPKEVLTETYIMIDAFPSSCVFETNSCTNYFKTKFVRSLIMLGSTSLLYSKNNFQFVPIQDFTTSSDIDWTKSIEEIDQQLYKKYGLSQNEIDFIESHIKPMP